MLATASTAAVSVVAAPTAVDCRFADVERADPERVIGALRAEFGTVGDSPCGASGAVAVATGVFGVAASSTTSDGTASAKGAAASDCSVGNAVFGCCVGNAAAGGSSGSAVAAVADTPVWVGFVLADAVVSPLDGDELVCAPPELCTIPVRGSGVEASPFGEVELAWASTEPSPIADVISEEEPVADADESVEDVGPVDDESVDDFGPVDDESEDEVEELESVGSASAATGVFATAVPMPSATANMPTRPICCTFSDIAIFLCYQGPLWEGNPSRPLLLLNRVIAVSVE